MNILIIHPVSCLAGAEQYLVSVIKSLDKKYQCFYLCQEPGPLTAVLESLNVKVIYLRMRAWRRFKYWFLNLLTLRKIIQFCRQNDIRLILSNSYRAAPYATLAAGRLKVPCVTVIHDFAPVLKLKRFRAFASDLIVAVSESIKQSFSRHYSKDIAVIYNGIDADAFAGTIKTKDKLSQEFPAVRGKKIVGMVANFIPLKGHKVFLKAMQSVLKQFPNAAFVIVGDTPDRNKLTMQELQDWARDLNMAQDVIFTGTRADVAELMDCFDVLVVASEQEAFGRVAIEAMALKKAVVATRCGGPQEIVADGKTGYLVEVNNISQMAQTVLKILQDSAHAKIMGEEGNKRVKELFAPQNTVVKFNQLFEQLLSK